MTTNADAPHLDRERIRALDLDPPIVASILATYVEDGARRLRALQEAASLGDSAGAWAQAHGLKGASYNVGAVAMGDACASLDRSVPPTVEQLARLADAFAATVAAIRASGLLEEGADAV